LGINKVPVVLKLYSADYQGSLRRHCALEQRQ